MSEPQYRRVLLKVSGEALAGEASRGLDFDVIGSVCDVIKKCVDLGVQVGVVVGGGNFWRGLKDGGDRMERTRADHMGMLATTINALAVADVLEQKGVDARADRHRDALHRRALHPLQGDPAYGEGGRVVIFGCGTGQPLLFHRHRGGAAGGGDRRRRHPAGQEHRRRVQRRPRKDPSAVKYDTITYDDVLAQHLEVMDSTATSLSMDNKIPVILFALKDPENILRVVMGEKIGTIVKEEP